LDFYFVLQKKDISVFLLQNVMFNSVCAVSLSLFVKFISK